jgi:transcriptional regulator with XRE-family HTH domain
MSAIMYIRKKHQLSLRALGKKLRIHSSYLTLAERDIVGLSTKKIKKIAKRLKEDEDVLRIAQGYMPEHIKNICDKDPERINAALKGLV